MNDVKFRSVSHHSDYMTSVSDDCDVTLVVTCTQNHLALEQDTLHVAVALIDNFLELQWLPLARLQLLGITALLVASKFEERFAPHVSLDRLMEQLVNEQQNHCESGATHITFLVVRRGL